MKKNFLAICCMLFCISYTYAQTLSDSIFQNTASIRLLSCTYSQSLLINRQPVNLCVNDWTAFVETAEVRKGVEYTCTFIAKKDMQDAGVAVAFDFADWSSDNFVMIPASVYNGNRQRIVYREYATGLDKSDFYQPGLALTSNLIPHLSAEFGAPSLIDINTSNTATPAIVCLERLAKKGTLLFTDQGISRNNQLLDHGLRIEESADRSRASFVISAPGVRARKPEFIGFSESSDRGITVKKGDTLCIRVYLQSFPCNDVPQLLTNFMQERKQRYKTQQVRNLMPMSEVFSRMIKNIDERFYESENASFYCPENANWMSYGWVGGLINTYPILALNDTLHTRKVQQTFDFSLLNGKGKSGYFYDVLGADGKVVYRDAALLNPGIGLTRKNGDVLYWMIKQFQLLKQQNKADLISPDWETSVRDLADAFVSTWKKRGTWGNYLDIETGDVVVYNTTSGAMAAGGLALASHYFNTPEYMDVAKQAAASYYADFSLLGFTSGGCGDILQNADSETAASLMTSLMTLYETTSDTSYLKQSADLAHLCATWTVSFPYRLPDETPLAKLGTNLTGAVWASTQNKHGAPGFCTQSGDALFKLYRATGDTLYADLLRDIIHAHAEGIQPNGKITERLAYCDADSRGSRGDGGQTGWNETNGALMALEIPGIYLRTDLAELFVFDHVEANITKITDKKLTLSVYNPTAYDADVTIFAENNEEAQQPLGDNGFLNWKTKLTVKAGRSKQITWNR